MYVVCWQGDWVWLKKCQNGETVTEISETTQSIFIKVRDKEIESKMKGMNETVRYKVKGKLNGWQKQMVRE